MLEFKYVERGLFLVKSKMAAKMATIVGDVTGPQQHHHPQLYTSSC